MYLKFGNYLRNLGMVYWELFRYEWRVRTRVS